MNRQIAVLDQRDMAQARQGRLLLKAFGPGASIWPEGGRGFRTSAEVVDPVTVIETPSRNMGDECASGPGSDGSDVRAKIRRLLSAAHGPRTKVSCEYSRGAIHITPLVEQYARSGPGGPAGCQRQIGMAMPGAELRIAVRGGMATGLGEGYKHPLTERHQDDEEARARWKAPDIPIHPIRHARGDRGP